MPDRPLSDGRIYSIRASDHVIATVGRGDVESIEVVDVAGQMAPVPWFEVLDGEGRVMRRVNAAHVVDVIYDREHEPEPGSVPF